LSTKKLQDVSENIRERSASIDRHIEWLNSADEQYKLTVSGINEFVERVFTQVSGNTDAVAVNQLLVDAILEIQRYLDARPETIQNDKIALAAQKAAFEECVALCQPDEEPKSAGSPSGEKDAFARIKDRLDQDGKMPSRKMGERPEKLKDVRGLQEQMMGEDILEEDI